MFKEHLDGHLLHPVPETFVHLRAPELPPSLLGSRFDLISFGDGVGNGKQVQRQVSQSISGTTGC